MDTMHIAGIGVISAAGLNVRENWDSVIRGKDSIRPIDRIPTGGLQTRNAGRIPLDDEGLKKLLGRVVSSDRRLPMERGEILLFIALQEALADAGIPPERLSQRRVGIFVGTSLSGFTRLEEDYRLFKSGEPRIRMSSYLTYPLHVCVDRVAYEYGIEGPRFLFSTACSASLHPVMMARELFAREEIDLALIGGTDPLSLMSLAGFTSIKSLAVNRCSPFSTTDSGISIGEGAGVLALEKRLLRPGDPEPDYPSVLGVAGTSDAYHPTASNPTGETIRICIEKALSGLDLAGEAPYVASHGTGTLHNDAVETRAIKQVAALSGAPVSAVKSAIGHTLGASGAVELALLAKALRERRTIPICNFSEPRPGCDLAYVRGEAGELRGSIGIKTAFAFGGNNVAVVIGPGEKTPPAFMANPRSGDVIVVTGVGIVSPADKFGLDALKAALADEKPFIKDIDPVRGFNRALSSSRAGTVDRTKLEAECARLRLKNVRKMDRISKLSAAAAALALADSNLRITGANAADVGLVSATGTGALASVADFYGTVLEKGVKFADANVFPNTVVNAHLGYISIELKIKGYTTVIAQGASSPYAALRMAQCLLQSGACRAILVGAVSEYSAAYHRALIDIGNAGSSHLQNCYAGALSGNVPGEGAVFFVLERNEDAELRNAKRYARVDSVMLDGSPGFPSTYAMRENPLERILREIKRRGAAPAYYAGEGNCLEADSRLEIAAVNSVFPDLPVTSASAYFGMASGVAPFYNLALYCLLSPEKKALGVPHGEESAARLLRGMRTLEGPMTALIGSLSAGGSAGAFLAGGLRP
ncbi:MAG: beta-ketoacyl-[acyl-carrier-protein] synthase family protein [Spirochaetales bacterium]|nr:beta-ketoacyl-[acyl-carrier-protein] synthase family protein [Spirochaetales bacterium]